MVEAELAIIGLDIAFPDLFAVHSEAGKLAVTGHDPDNLPSVMGEGEAEFCLRKS